MTHSIASAPPAGSAWDERLTGNRGNAFDAVRLVLATLVVLEHSYFLLEKSSLEDPLSLLSGAQTNCGHFAVVMFFVISGFLVTRSLTHSRSVWHYLLKRVARIVPGFLVASAFGCLVVGPLTSLDAGAFMREQSWRLLTVTVLALKQVAVTGALVGNPLPMVHGTLWTIKYEFDCYLILAILGALGLVRAAAPAILAYVALALALAAGAALGLPVVDRGIAALLISSPNQWPDLFPFFLAGSAFYLWRHRIPKSPTLMAAAVAALGISFRVGGAWWALLICGTYTILFICLSASADIYIGGRHTDLSYGVYLYGWPIQQLLIFYFGPHLTPMTLFVVAVVATYSVAWVTWTVIEEPTLGLVRRPRLPQPHAQAVRT
jgi:peptidoglycan/LPS O-acetylase OafA/YrhL